MCESFDEAWVRCAPWLEAALARDPTHSLEDVRRLCLTRPDRYHFWPGEDAAIVSQLIASPRSTDLHVWLGGGALATLQQAVPSLEAFARALGCDRITLAGRAGWGRALDGFAPQFTAFAKGLR